jgi:hypothetical protein
MDTAPKILDIVVKRAGAKIKKYKRKHQTDKQWFESWCQEERKSAGEGQCAFRKRNDAYNRMK